MLINPAQVIKPSFPDPAPAVTELLHTVQAAVASLKAMDVSVIDVQGKSNVTDFLVIASGTSTRHVSAIADEVIRFVKQLGIVPLGIEGAREAEWILVDLADVVVHLMLPRVREFYSLERLWAVGDVDQPPID